MAAFDHNGLPGSALDRELRGLNCRGCDWRSTRIAKLEHDLAAAKDTISKYHERIISQHAQIDDLKWSLWKIEGKHKAAILEVITKLAAAQEARQADEDRLWSAIGGREAHWIEHHDEDGTLRRDQLTLEGALIFLHGASERSQRAEALAESYRDALNRFKEEREGNTRQFQRLQHRLAQSEADNSSLAVGQCIVSNGGLMGDEHGNLYCDMQRQRDEQRGRLRVMADIMNTALDVMKTVEGDGSDEDEALMHIRAKMASAIDSVRRADKAAIDSARGESNG